MKKLSLLILLIPTLLLGCSNNIKTSKQDPLFGFTYTAAEEVAIDVSRPGVEVVSVEVINIPDSGIKIADWDNSNIKFHVSYNDSTTEDFDFLVKHIPLDQRHYLGEIGHHNIELLINGISTKFGFNIIKNPDFTGYRCTFNDSYSEGTVYETTVGYYQTVTYEGPSFPYHAVGTEYIRSFIGWDYPLTNVHQDMVYNSVYRDTEKRFYGDSVKEGESHVVSTYADESDGAIHVLTYLGRVHRAAFNYSETIYHERGDESVELSFQDIKMFNERWEQLNKNIVNYGLHYSFDNTTGQYLFGSNNALTNAPTFLSAFESIYPQVSYTTTLDNDFEITTSSYPNYATVYGMARDHIDETKTVGTNLETGYYRLAIVANFDAFVSVSFKKLANGKYSLEKNSKYMFAPVTTSIDVIAQFSETEDFINTFDKKVEFSNTMLYNIAVGLDWGN